MEQVEALTIQDAESAQNAILSLILKYPSFPLNFKANNKTVRWNDTGVDACIGIFPLNGSRYIKKYVSGSYTAQLPFQIQYISSPTTNHATIDSQMMVENLGKWLEDAGIEFKDSHMSLESISRTSVVFPIMQDEKRIGYGINMQLKYFYKK